MIGKSKQFNSNGRTILNVKLVFKPIIQRDGINFASEIRQRLNYNVGGEYQIHADQKENLPCRDLAEYLIKQEFIVPMVGKKGKISGFEKHHYNPEVVYAFEPDIRRLNLRIRAVSTREMDLNKTLDIRALDSFIGYGYVSKQEK